MLPVFLFALTLITAVTLAYFKPNQKLEMLLKSVIFFNIGGMGLLGFYGHTFMADEIAKAIGWAPGSPFQFEVAVANLAFGVLGILTPFTRPSFWLATVLGFSIFLFGAAWGHLVQLRLGDTAPYNSGVFLWFGDIILPIFYLGLMLVYYSRLKRI